MSPRAHVIRLDEASLPDGYELVTCERNTRSAHEPHSRFVDAQGGMLWEADFSVRRTDGRATASDAFEARIERFDEPVAAAQADFDEFGLAWLDGQAVGTGFAYPAENHVPDIASLDFGLMHPRGAEVSVYVNGVPVDFAHMAERLNSSDRTMALSSFRGVALEEGENRLSAVVRDAETKLEIGRATRAVWFVREAARAEVLEERSELLADGRAVPTIAVRLSDAGGRPVHTGRLVEVAVEPPHSLLERVVAEEIMPIGTPQLSGGTVTVGADGVMLVRLAPTTVSGLVEMRVPTVNGERVITAMLSPAERDWIVVGLGDGILGDPTNAVGVQDMENPRLAAYAQGTVGDGWLITGAIDTAKDDDEEANELFRQVDPDDRYALYGDRSDQRFDAQSRFPVYLRAERGGTKAVVGDFDTAMSETTLGRYERRLTGAHATHRDDKTALTAFVAETDQLFRRDEIAADGTSGPYRVDATDIVVHSELVAVETRDLFRPDVILGLRTLTRFVDYDLDYDTGELVFTAPVNASDSLYDTNVIVVSYEAESGQGGEASAGARATRQLGRARIGAAVVHEGGLGANRGDATLASADALIQVTDSTLIRAEIAVQRTDGRDDASAVLIEAEHASERVVGKAWVPGDRGRLRAGPAVHGGAGRAPLRRGGRDQAGRAGGGAGRRRQLGPQRALRHQGPGEPPGGDRGAGGHLRRRGEHRAADRGPAAASGPARDGGGARRPRGGEPDADDRAAAKLPRVGRGGHGLDRAAAGDQRGRGGDAVPPPRLRRDREAAGRLRDCHGGPRGAEGERRALCEHAGGGDGDALDRRDLEGGHGPSDGGRGQPGRRDLRRGPAGAPEREGDGERELRAARRAGRRRGPAARRHGRAGRAGEPTGGEPGVHVGGGRAWRIAPRGASRRDGSRCATASWACGRPRRWASRGRCQSGSQSRARHGSRRWTRTGRRTAATDA